MNIGHVTSIANMHVDHIKGMAQFSADQDLGPQSNPFRDDCEQFKQWNDIYYARIQENAIACAQ